jgi:hypothetical protein
MLLPTTGDAFDFDSMGLFLGILEGRVRLMRGEDDGEGALSRLLRVNGLEACASDLVAKVVFAGDVGGEIAESGLLWRE